MKNVEKELAKWIEDCVKNRDFDTTFHYELDDDLSVHIGYIDGFDGDDLDDGEIHDEDNPTYCLCVKIGDAVDDDYEYCLMPYDTDNGDVYDTDTSVGKNCNYKATAKWLVKEYKEIREGLDNETLTF